MGEEAEMERQETETKREALITISHVLTPYKQQELTNQDFYTDTIS